MKRIVTLGIALAALVSATAQPVDGPRQRPLPPLIVALDADTNQVVSAAEIVNAATALKSLDKNNDGDLSNDELMPQRPGGPSASEKASDRKRFASPLETALDADSDGTISVAEIAAAPTALKKLDKDGDGQLSRDELMPQRPGGPGPGGPGGPPPGR